MTNDVIIQILHAAKERLFRNGWVKNMAGKSSGPACLVGAILFAAKYDLDLEDYNYPEEAYDAILEVLPEGTIPTFNDEPGTTFDDVVNLLDLTIKSLESK